MRHPALLLFVAVGLSAPAGCLKVPPELPDEPGAMHGAPSTAGEVLDRYVEGSGGEAALKALPARTIEARMILRAQEDCGPDDETCLAEDQVGSFLLRTTADGKLYRRTVLGDLVEEKGFDGEVGWVLSGDVLQIETGQELVLSREDAVLHWYFDVDDRGVQVTLARPRKQDHEGQVMELDGVYWEQPGTAASPKTLWFDRATGLLREEVVEEGEGDELQRQTIIYDDYREVDGVQVPYLIRVVNELGDQEQIVEFVTQRVSHAAIEPQQFAMPVLPDPEPAPDERLAALKSAQQEAAANADDASAHVALARAAWVAGHFDEAMQAAKKTLEIDPREPEATLLLARLHVMRGELRQAQSVLRKASATGLRPEIVAREHAWIHYRNHDFPKLAKALDGGGNPVLAGRFRSFVGKPLQAKTKGCVHTLPMVATEPLAVVEIEVEGEPVQAIVDTGASDLILSQTFTAARGISMRPLGNTPPDTPTVGFAQAESLAVGDVTLSAVPVDVFDDRAMTEMAGPRLPEVKAVLGMSLLSAFQVTVDVPGKSLELVSTEGRCRSDLAARRVGIEVPFWEHETHYLYVMAEMNDAEGIYLLNTGMRGADLTATRLAYAHAGIGTPPIRSGEAPMVQVRSFEIGQASFPGVEAAFGFFEQTSTGDGFRLDGMIGMGVVGRRRWTLDFDTRKIYFADAATPAEAEAKGGAKPKGDAKPKGGAKPK